MATPDRAAGLARPSPACTRSPPACPSPGFSGTLGNGRRFTGGDSKGQVGLVRAKTGTLNNVNTLAGLATTKDGRLVTFAFMADRVPAYAEPALDRLAAIVARS